MVLKCPTISLFSRLQGTIMLSLELFAEAVSRHKILHLSFTSLFVQHTLARISLKRKTSPRSTAVGFHSRTKSNCCVQPRTQGSHGVAMKCTWRQSDDNTVKWTWERKLQGKVLISPLYSRTGEPIKVFEMKNHAKHCALIGFTRRKSCKVCVVVAAAVVSAVCVAMAAESLATFVYSAHAAGLYCEAVCSCLWLIADQPLLPKNGRRIACLFWCQRDIILFPSVVGGWSQWGGADETFKRQRGSWLWEEAVLDITLVSTNSCLNICHECVHVRTTFFLQSQHWLAVNRRSSRVGLSVLQDPSEELQLCARRLFYLFLRLKKRKRRLPLSILSGAKRVKLDPS